MTLEQTIFVVDDDEATQHTLTQLLGSAGLRVKIFPNAKTLLATITPDTPGCLLLDVHIPDMCGLQLQQILSQQSIALPIIFITRHADVSMAVQAMKAGAIDFLEKPFRNQDLLNAVQQALQQDTQSRQHRARHDAIAARMAQLTQREHQVLERIIAGDYNKVIAAKLGIGISTVEAHRKKVMEKLQANSLSELVCLFTFYKGKP